ncbi:uncharacterized protein K441DRAFT_697070 [Cenococcum geophilum 1.58]|uniref:uncharacterized protein n=1 Tax=Cenococcum geophilum 1.58 TaxID=794803 RepID=UPI00358FE02B|nr:hypothetical protein K441DRAFT_697070 [Cenococcum geophilum 1.58]
MDSATAAPSAPPVTSGQSINVVSWILLCIMLLSVATRLGTKFTIIRKLEADDGVACLAMLFSSAQTITLSTEIANGLGRHYGDLDKSELLGFQKSSYASNILFIATIWLAKTAVALQVRQLTPVLWQLHLIIGFVIFLAIWGITAIFAASFQCGLPHPYQTNGNHCFNQAVFWDYFGVTNIITDFVLILLPVNVLWDIQINRGRKVAILGCFASRLLVIIAIICQLVYSRGVYTSSDLTYDVWKTTLCAQFVQNLSVVASSIPYLKPFYMGLESGLIRNDDLRRLGSPSEYGYGPAMWMKAGSKTSGRNTQTSERTQSERHDPGALPYGARSELNAYNESRPAGSLRSSEGDTTSQSRIVRSP